MIKMILITEECSEGSFTVPYDYDLLPSNIKTQVQNALKTNTKSTPVDIYKDGLQYLYDINHPEIKTGEVVEFMDSVTLYHAADY